MKTKTVNNSRRKFVNGKIKYVIIILAFLSFALIVYSQIPKTSAATNINYAEYDYNNVDGTDVNVTITASAGVLEDGGVSIWGFGFEVYTNATVPNVAICGSSNGSKYARGLTFPTSKDLEDDTTLKGLPIGPFNQIFAGFVLETLILAPGVYGIPNTFSFDMNIFVGNSTNNQTLFVKSGDKPLIAFIFQNPETIPELGSVFFALMYGLPFLLPITIILVNVMHKKLEKRKELKIKEGGLDKDG